MARRAIPFIIEGRRFLAAPRVIESPKGPIETKRDFEVFWIPEGVDDGDRDKCVRLGFLTPWSGGQGWRVHPRLGGNHRACAAACGLSRTRAYGVRRLLDLARAEPSLTTMEKIEFRILREVEGGQLVDESKMVTAVP